MTESGLEHEGARVPAFYYGWAMAGVSTAAMIATGPGQTVIVSQFNTSLREDLGISASALSAAYMVGTICAALPLVFVGRASDRFGPRAVMGAVALLFGLACAGTGLVRGIATLTVAFFLLRFLGQGSLGLVSGHALAMWFERRLGTVNGVKIVVSQLAFAFMPALVLTMIETLGWRQAYAWLGAGVCALVLPLVVLVARNRPEDVGQRIDGDAHVETESAGEYAVVREPDPAFRLWEALRTPAFWIVCGTTVLSGLVGTALLFHMQPMLEWRSLDAMQSDEVVRSWSLAVMVCVLPAGWLADKLPARTLLPLAVVLVALATALPLMATRELHFHLSMAAFGVSQALTLGVGAPTVARYFGRAHHGAIRGTVMKLGVAGTGLGPVVLGVSVDWSGSFAPGLVACLAMCVPVLIGGLTLRKPEPPERG